MKNITKLSFFLALFMYLGSTISAQDYKADDVLGLWLNADEDGKIEIYKENGKYYGKLIWLLNPIDEETGKPKLDKRNPDDALKTRPTKGIILMSDFEYDGDGEWDEGDIYDPKSGNSYSCYVKLESMDKLKVRGYMGISLLGRTTYWTRIKK